MYFKSKEMFEKKVQEGIDGKLGKIRRDIESEFDEHLRQSRKVDSDEIWKLRMEKADLKYNLDMMTHDFDLLKKQYEVEKELVLKYKTLYVETLTKLEEYLTR